MAPTEDKRRLYSDKPQIVVPFLNNEVRTGRHRRLLELCEDLAQKDFNATVLLNSDLSYTPRYFTEKRIHCPYVLGKTLSLSSFLCDAHLSVNPEYPQNGLRCFGKWGDLQRGKEK